MRVIEYGGYALRVTVHVITICMPIGLLLMEVLYIALTQNSAEVQCRQDAIDLCDVKAVVAKMRHPRAYWNATDGPWVYSSTCVQCVLLA